MTEAAVIAALRATLESDAAADRFSGTVLVGRIENGAGVVLFSEAYGLADREKKVANTLETRFRIGSMNKMFTATSVMQLVQAEKITLTAPLETYVTDYPNRNVARSVTIEHLLTHTGGTGDIFGPDFDAHRLELHTMDDYVTLYGQRDLAFAPGTRWTYSNYGMLLLGVVIERVSGQSYYDYVDDHVYNVAGMTRSGSEPESAHVEGRSVPYTWDHARASWVPATNTLPYRGDAAGGGYSTVGDLMNFATALMNNTLLNPENTTLLIQGKVDTDYSPPGPRRQAYGFGDERDANGAGAVGHGGGGPGANSVLRIYPQSGYVTVVLANRDPEAAMEVSSFLDERLAK